MRLYISTFAPTSMPRVGSLRIISLGSVFSPLATTTFCWLPPESESTSVMMPGVLMPSFFTHSWAICFSSLRCMMPLGANFFRLAMVTLSRTGEIRHTPSLLRSAGT